MILMGFGHRARQGKNTAALAVLNACALETQVRLYAFGDALRAEVRKACAISGGQFELIRDWKNAGLMPDWVHFEEPKPRSLLQWWGTEYRRSKDPLYWVKALRKTLSDHNPEIALITDVRFPNEVTAIHDWGGVVVKCTRLGPADVPVHEHASEAALDGYRGWDYYISADTIPEVQRQAREVYGEVRRNAFRG